MFEKPTFLESSIAFIAVLELCLLFKSFKSSSLKLCIPYDILLNPRFKRYSKNSGFASIVASSKRDKSKFSFSAKMI